MAGTQPGSLFEKLKALRLPASEYVIFGSGPLFAHGLLGEVRDIDVVARDPPKGGPRNSARRWWVLRGTRS